MIGCLRRRVRKQPIIGLYFEFENELKFYKLEARYSRNSTLKGIVKVRCTKENGKLLFLPNKLFPSTKAVHIVSFKMLGCPCFAVASEVTSFKYSSVIKTKHGLHG